MTDNDDKEKKTKRKNRSSNFTPIIIKEIEEMAACGMTQNQISHNLGVNFRTLSIKKWEMPELREALERGRARGVKRVTSKLMENCDAGKENSIFFYLCNRDWENWKPMSKLGGNSDERGDVSKMTELVHKLIDKMPS